MAKTPTDELIALLKRQSASQKSILSALEELGRHLQRIGARTDDMAGLRQQFALLAEAIPAFLAASSNQSQLLDARLQEIVSGLNNQSSLLDKKLSALIEGAINQAEVLNARLGHVRPSNDRQSVPAEPLRPAGFEDVVDQPEASEGDPSETPLGPDVAAADDRRASHAYGRPAASASDHHVSMPASPRRKDRADRGRVFYICHSAHPNDQIYAEHVADYLTCEGIAHKRIVLNPGDERLELQQCLNGDALGVLGFNATLDRSRISSTSFLDAAAEANVPVIHWMFDHPSTLWPKFRHSTAANSRFLFLSEFSRHYFHRYIMSDAVSACVTTTGISAYSRVPRLTWESFAQREIRCILPLNLTRVGGTLEDVKARIAALDGKLSGAVGAAIEGARNDLDKPIELHLTAALAQAVLDIPSYTFHSCVQMVEEFVQIMRRLWVFEVAQEFPVLIQSDIASRYLSEGGRATIDENVDMRSTYLRMTDSQSIVSLAHVNDELHNSTLNGLNAGCVNLIEDNVAHRRLFTRGKNALLFRYDDDSLRACLDLICSKPRAACEIALAGMAMRDEPHLRSTGFANIVALATERFRP